MTASVLALKALRVGFDPIARAGAAVDRIVRVSLSLLQVRAGSAGGRVCGWLGKSDLGALAICWLY